MSQVSQRNISNLEETEKRLQLLSQITSQTANSLNTQLDKALELTTNLLGMEIAIISSISGDIYTIRNFYPEDSGLALNQEFPLGNTYCSITLESEGIFSVNHMKKSDYERHPCYEAFSLESYIGIPLIIDGELYGTINFSSSKPKENGFLPSDHTLLQLLGDWAGGIIKRSQIEEKLKDRNQRYKLISSNSADLICLHDLDGNYKFVSPSAKSILGFSYKELLGRNHAELVHEDDVKMLREKPFQLLKKKGVVINQQYRVRKKTGDFIWFESSLKTIFDEDNNPIGLQSISREVTERKRLETLFEQAQEMANIGGWEYYLKTGKLYWTDEVYRIHGKKIGSEVKIDEGLSFFQGESREKLEEAISKTIKTGEQYDLTLEFISEKGIEKWVRAIGKAHFQNGEATKLAGTFQDISRQVESEQKILAQNEELLSLTKTRDKLYSIIAHDLKGAFFGINGMLDIVMEEFQEINAQNWEEESEDIKDNMNLALVSAQDAYELLENLLEWLKVQNGKVSISKEKVNLKVIIEASIHVFKSLAENKNIVLEQNIQATIATLDSNVTPTIVRNLISNAIKFSNEGGHITVSTREVDHGVEIIVKDEGIGMTKEIKELLFDKDTRPQRRGTLQEKGTGLGLLLCAELVEAHGGSIVVNSEEGKGSEFIVTLSKA